MKTNRIPNATAKRDVPKPPRFLSKEARQWWRFFAACLAERGTVTVADMGGLAELCEVSGELARLRKTIADRGGATAYEAVSVSGEKLWRAYPETAQAADASRRLRSMLAEYGLTPRTRKSAAPAKRAV